MNSRSKEYHITGSTGWRRLKKAALRFLILLFLMMAASGVCTSSSAQQAEPVGTTPVKRGQQRPAADGNEAPLTTRERPWLLRHDGLTRIGMTAIPPQVLRDDEPYKGLFAVIDEERRDINRRWISVGDRRVIGGRTFWTALAAGLALIVLIVAGAMVLYRMIRRIIRQRTSQLQHELEERKKAERQIQASEQLFRALVENSPDFIARYDRDFQRIYFNPAIQELFGEQAETAIGKTPADQSPLTAPQLYMDHLRQAIETATESVAEIPFRTTQGEMHWGHLRFVPEFGPYGHVVSVLTIGRDIHEIKENEQRFRMLAENFPDFVVRFDHDGHYTYVNPAVEKAFGLPAGAIIGKTMMELPQHRKPEQNDALLTLIRQAFERGVANQSELHLETEDGERILEIRNAPEKDATGNVVSVLSIARDITERKQAQEKLERERALLRCLIDSASDLIFIKDQDRVYRACNKASEAFIGMPESEQIGKTDYDFFDRDKAEQVRKTDKQVLDRGEPLHIEEWLTSHDGRRRLMDTVKTPFYDPDGKALGLVGIGRDITERKRAEERMLLSEQRLRLHSEKSPLGFLEWDHNFHAVEWNAACERIFGYTRQEAIGRHARDLILPEGVHGQVNGIFQSLMHQTGGQHSINENITKDGRLIICEWFNTTLIDKDGKAVGVASICRDITEQKRMEEELSRYREHLEEQVKERTAELEIAKNKAQQYLNIAGVMLVAIDPNRRVTLINQKGCEVLGYSAREIIGKDWIDTFVPANIRPAVIQGFRKLMAGEIEPVEYFENTVLTRDGQERLIAWHNVLLRDDGGAIVGTLSSGEDITEQKRAEKQIKSLNQDLMYRTAALEAANKELEAFAYSVSHDLRAPLRHIDGFLELLQKRVGTTLDNQGRHYMDNISESAQKMGQLIDDLLSFSRTGRLEISFRQIKLEPLVQDVFRELEPDIAGRMIDWCVGDLPVVSGDRAMLRTVLVNLISNALKFTRPREKARIEIGSLPGRSSETVIFVRDNGVGFDMAYGDKLFGVFQRLHYEDEFEGTGIGLAIVRRIIARHGGRTWAAGELNQGATFYFSLPGKQQGGGDERP